MIMSRLVRGKKNRGKRGIEHRHRCFWPHNLFQSIVGPVVPLYAYHSITIVTQGTTITALCDALPVPLDALLASHLVTEIILAIDHHPYQPQKTCANADRTAAFGSDGFTHANRDEFLYSIE